MRVIKERLAHRDDERGAVAVIVVLCMIAVFAMVVLTVDVGGLLFERRAMVNAADAAALAAAQSCATAQDTSLPEDQADKYAKENVSDLPADGINNITEIVGCDTFSGHVTVQYTEQHQLFFAAILPGQDDEGTITTAATAEWVPGGSTNPVPFVIAAGAFQTGNCDVPNVPVDTVCHFWEDNGGGGAGGFGGSSFGYIDVNPDSWNVDPNTCPNNSNKNSLRDYAAAGGYDGSRGPLLPLNYPDPTWACGVNGLETPTFDALAENIGEILAFPVVDSVVVTQGSFVKAWNVIGFVKMELVNVIRAKDGGDGGSIGSCSDATIPAASATAGSTHTLSVFSATGCPNSTSAPDQVTNVSLRGCGNGANSGCTLGPDYTLVPSTGVPLQVKFTRTMTNPIQVSFDWEYYGVCGPPAQNYSGYCFLLKWKGVQLGNAEGGADFGITKVRLCDESLAVSCKST